MKRNWIRILAIVLMLGMLSGCTMISPSTLESMFGSKDTTAAATAVPTEAVSSGEDTVTISLEEYQRLNRFAELNEIYDLAQALQGQSETLLFFKCDDDDKGNREITYPYYDASIVLTIEEAKDSLRYLENKYMEGMDADTWYGYRRSMAKALYESD